MALNARVCGLLCETRKGCICFTQLTIKDRNMCQLIESACRKLKKIFGSKKTKQAIKEADMFDEKVKKLSDELREWAKEQNDRPFTLV
jgi:Na+/phosphate symporter